MAKVEEIADEIIIAKEQLMNINNTINRDRGVLSDLNKKIAQNKELYELAEKKLAEITDEVSSLHANKDAVEKEY
jgi:chromosome segregation ATPase